MLRVIELFSGIGAPRMALMLAGIEHEVVAISEINKHAVASYNAIYGDTKNLGDISKVDALPDCDLLTYGFPCQDISLAGKRAGMGQGTRSGLVWEVLRLLRSAKNRPTWLLMENVPTVFKYPEFQTIVDELADMGYRSKWAKLDSSMFGSAQKRVRAFMVSRLGEEPPDLPTGNTKPHKVIRDIMEESVDDYYIQHIPLERIMWRAPRDDYHNPQSDGLVCPLMDCTDSRLESRRITAERSLSPTVKANSRIKIVSEEEEERAKSVCDKADTLRMAKCGEIVTVGKDGTKRMVSKGVTTSTPIAELKDETYYPSRVLYSDDGCAPTLPNMGRHGKKCLPKIVSVERASERKTVQMTLDGLSQDDTSCSPIAEDVAQSFYSRRMLYDPNRQSPTVRADHGQNYRIKVVATMDGKVIEMWRRIYDDDGLSPACVAHTGGQRDVKVLAGVDDVALTVRVITPLESWRLMGFPDWAYDRASTVSSRTQLYTQAGNSIVVDVLATIFKVILCA